MTGSHGRDGAGRVRLALRTQLWPLPVVGLVASIVLGVCLTRLDAAVDDTSPLAGSGFVFGGGASAARSVLGGIASSMITVTSLTFSLTVVTLQLASSQFSPRLLRTFSRDRFVHLTLALLVATFTYSLTVLRTVRESSSGGAEFVPQISVTVAFVLAVAGVLALVLFLAHLAREIRVETMLRRVRADAEATIGGLLEKADDRTPAVVPAPPPGAVHLMSAASGFVVHVDYDMLLEAAAEADAVIVVDRGAGASVVAGTPTAVTWPRAAQRLGDDDLERLRQRFDEAMSIGIERTESQDLGFGLRQLVDVVNKALSPGINDPTTAVHALDHVSALLCELARRDPGPVLLCDEDGRLAVVVQRPDLAELLDTAMTQPGHYAAGDPLVLDRLFGLLRELAWTVITQHQRQAVTRHLARLRATVERQTLETMDEARLHESAALVEQALAGRWPVRIAHQDRMDPV